MIRARECIRLSASRAAHVHVRRWHGKTMENFRPSSGAAIERAETETAAHPEQEETLHPTWRSLEQRLRNKRPVPVGRGPRGRTTPPPSEEDVWLREAAYSLDQTKPPSHDSASTRTDT
jgi:hypothetical protein